MKAIKLVGIYLATFGVDLVIAWPMVLGVWALWGTGLRWERGILSTEFKADSWPLRPGMWPKGFYLRQVETDPRPRPWGGTSVGHGHLYGPGRRTPKGAPPTPIQVHEEHHTRQAEAAQVAAFLEGLILGGSFLALGYVGAAFVALVALWVLGGNVAVSIGGWAAAWLTSDPRGFYGGSAHEVGAYAVGDLYQSRQATKSQPPPIPEGAR